MGRNKPDVTWCEHPRVLYAKLHCHSDFGFPGAVAHELLVERCLSPARDGYPDIDLEIEFGRCEGMIQEEMIQYAYDRYEHGRAAQVANVVAYQPRSAICDVAETLGLSPGQQDAWSKRVEYRYDVDGASAPPGRVLDPANQVPADVRATGVSPDDHPIRHLRERLDRFGAIRIDRLDGSAAPADPEHPPRVLVGGLVTHRQRPAAARGVSFLDLEDESGVLSMTCSEGLWVRHRSVAIGSSALLVRGRLERSPEGVLNLVADRMQKLPLTVPVYSRDFR